MRCQLQNRPLWDSLALEMAWEGVGEPGTGPLGSGSALLGMPRGNFCPPAFLSHGKWWRQTESWGWSRMLGRGSLPLLHLHGAPVLELSQSSPSPDPASAATSTTSPPIPHPAQTTLISEVPHDTRLTESSPDPVSVPTTPASEDPGVS